MIDERGRWGGRWRLLLPWVAARRLYGPYGVRQWREGEFGVEVEQRVAGVPVPVPVDPLLRVLVPVRAWIGLGLIVLVVKFRDDPDLSDRVEDIWYHGAITMVLGPYGVFVAIALLWLLAGRGRRAGVFRRTHRSAVVAGFSVLLSVGVFGLQLPGVRQAVGDLLHTVAAAGGPLTGLLALVAGPWLFVFGLCAVFLMHRNGFSAGADPYLRPIVTSWMACMVAAVELTVADRAGVPDTRFVLATLAGPALAIALGVVEMIRLRWVTARRRWVPTDKDWNLPQG